LRSPVLNPAPLASRIQGSGQMAELIRSKDWSATPLGAMETWSETLCATVNILLLSPFSFSIYWGTELTLLYNDVYRQFLPTSIHKPLEPQARKSGRNGKDFSAEYRVVQPDGSIRWVSALGRCFQDEAGRTSLSWGERRYH
jgi:hypothetical protein